MSLLSPQVRAFIAVLEEASFERAAKRLSITPSAVSQRIKQLEEKVGQLLVIRQFPCQPTPAGEKLLSRVKPMSLLEAEVLEDFMPEADNMAHAKTFSIAVNEDSLSTWLLGALSDLYQEHNHQFDIQIDNEDFTVEHLKNGTVIGALTSEKKPLQGCVSHSIGAMRYFAVATPEFYQQYFKHGLTKEAFRQAPMLDYDHKDLLQRNFIEMIINQPVFPTCVHYIPSALGLVDAVKNQMGWCVTQEGLVGNAIESGDLINIAPNVFMDVPLYWQHAGVRSRVLEQITRAFFNHSASVLYR
ncbi:MULTISPECIES: LysR family transcriptional regulator ArgP [Vibrio]|uniref:ArgP/LysG family DNA-binding transcriptional regulator n=2 Tax=Vibrio TaxID=662 RepID=A0A7X4LPU2_9VIBR|nr:MULTISPECIES: LysR family transcriptional regulator ArgP [Vibrio]MBF9003314.1 LysR family transcriptional regulator ArgP [Vibrio nitrifigilis]MZI95690.1 ArgP/LysG family DNA-binding transcriptional regulator [Vibrio eleionomae]